MSIQRAINFFDAYRDDQQLRSYLNILNSPDRVKSFLNEIDMSFSINELEDAYNLLLMNCSDEADHNLLTQIKLSYLELTAE